MTVNAMEAAAGAVRAAHREQCFDAIRRTLGLGDTKGDTGAWLDWIDAVAPGKSTDEVVKLTMEQKRAEGTLGSKTPPVNWSASGPWEVNEGDNLANVRLMSAAPDMLAALKSLTGWLGGKCVEGDTIGSLRRMLTDASRAIAKAEGHQDK
jgi:hypothetical protein